MRVLIIEDEKDLADFVKMNLETRGGYDVSVTNDGETGLKKAREENYDVVILDLCLPGLPGEEVCREIRRDRRVFSTPIIMITAKDSDADRIVGKVIGADRYITKPFRIDELVKNIEEIVETG